jgi:hypothetical protein
MVLSPSGTRNKQPAYSHARSPAFYQWNDLQYFSAIDAPGLAFEIQCVT